MNDRLRGGSTIVAAVLLAAGESTRMGRLKALLPWPAADADVDTSARCGSSPPLVEREQKGQRTLLEYQLTQLLAAPVDACAVVLGHERARLEPLVAGRARVVVNPDYPTGKCSSIIAGVRATPPDAHLLVLAVDQPRSCQIVTRVIEAHLVGRHLITVAGCGGRRGHPVIFAPALRRELLTLREEDEGLRAVLRRHAAAVRTVEFETPLVLANLNTSEDYEQALRSVEYSLTTSSSTSSSRAGSR